jgi:tetratricopeptide (TPR) repeat protein/TolB-like protein
VPHFLSQTRTSPLRTRFAACIAVLFLIALPELASVAQAQTATPGSNGAQNYSGRLVLVLPFENHSGDSSLDWIGESFTAILNQRLGAAGFLPISREDRMNAMEHLGLPKDFKPSRATTFRVAQTMDADYVIIGSYTTTQDKQISAQAQVLQVRVPSMTQPVVDSTPMRRLLDLENAIAWKLASTMDPNYSVAEETFLAASANLQLSAFEDYIRGLIQAAPEDRIPHLKMAVQISPTYTPAVLALGRAYYDDQQYDKAASTLAMIPHENRQALEAGFYLGLSYFNSGQYAKAENAFAFVATQLPLPEVVNNQGVAASRQGKDAGALFERACNADPLNPDYHYNFAIVLLHRKDLKDALLEVQQTLKLRPNDNEATQLQQLIQKSMATPAAPAANSAASAGRPAAATTSTTVAANGFQPVERISRTYSEASFRQAAFELDQVRAMHIRRLPVARQVQSYVAQGTKYLAQGLSLEAEREFQAALKMDGNSAAAHAGLAQVRVHNGNAEEARKEAQLSLQLKPNATAYLVLARLDLRAKQLAAAAKDVSQALQLEPDNADAKGMQTALAAQGETIP